MSKLIIIFVFFYSIKSGVQGKDHPNPGKKFYALGFPRVCYLPDTAQGRKVSFKIFT